MRCHLAVDWQGRSGNGERTLAEANAREGSAVAMGRRLDGCAQRICRPGKRNVQGSETARHQDYEREHHRYRALRQWRV